MQRLVTRLVWGSTVIIEGAAIPFHVSTLRRPKQALSHTHTHTQTTDPPPSSLYDQQRVEYTFPEAVSLAAAKPEGDGNNGWTKVRAWILWMSSRWIDAYNMGAGGGGGGERGHKDVHPNDKKSG